MWLDVVFEQTANSTFASGIRRFWIASFGSDHDFTTSKWTYSVGIYNSRSFTIQRSDTVSDFRVQRSRNNLSKSLQTESVQCLWYVIGICCLFFFCIPIEAIQIFSRVMEQFDTIPLPHLWALIDIWWLFLLSLVVPYFNLNLSDENEHQNASKNSCGVRNCISHIFQIFRRSH